jgi:uncharacterized protein (TIRG00374 family)
LDRKAVALIITGILLFILYLIWANPFAALLEVGRFNAVYYIIAVIVNQIGLIFFAASWWVLVKIMNLKISFIEGIKITYTSLFIGWLIPIPLNTEVVRAYLLNIKKRSKLGQAICSVVVHRAFYNIAFGLTVCGAAFTIIIFERNHLPVDPWLILSAVFFATVTSIFFAAILNPRSLEVMYNYSPLWIKKHFFDNFIDYQQQELGFQGFIINIDESMKVIKGNLSLTLLSFVLILFHWISGSITAYYSAKSLGVDFNLPVIILIYVVVEFIQQVNIFIPSGLGIIDAGLTGAFVLAGVPLHLAAGISLLTRLATYWFEVVVCAPIAFNFGYKELLNNTINENKAIV